MQQEVRVTSSRKARNTVGLVIAALLFAGAVHAQSRYDPTRVRPRVIVTTDGEIDDRCSMVRFLMYANEWDIEGLIYSSSRFHWLGHTWSGVEWLNAQIDQYARVYHNLRQHADGYPLPEELKRLVYVGNIKNVGEMDEDTPGADRIVQVLLDDKPGPVYLQAWGGTNTIAKALAKIQKQHPSQIEKVNGRRSSTSSSTRTRPSGSTSSPTGRRSRCSAASVNSARWPTTGSV
jgi:hypothetical protein